MKFTKYGITLSLMKEHDIEMVRQWRNDPVVVRNYEFREYITPEMQARWFRSVHNTRNFYAIIEYRGKKAGVINIKNIDWEKREGEGGIFIPDPVYHMSALPAILSVMTTEMQFSVFGWGTGYASVLKENASSRNFIMSLGFRLCPGEEEKNNQRYFNTKENFEKTAGKIRKAIAIVAGKDEPGTLLFENSEFGDPVVMQWEAKFLENAKPAWMKTTPEGRLYCIS